MAMVRRSSRHRGTLAVTLLAASWWAASDGSASGQSFLAPAAGRRALLVGGTLQSVGLLRAPGALAGDVAPWEGKYEDPEHPGCKRDISVKDLDLKLYAADGRPGCGNGEKERKWNITGRLSLAAYNEAILDYRPRGGSEKQKVLWEDGKIKFFGQDLTWTKVGATPSGPE
eukprot:TRINITY_DN37870_c0_g1_i1.p1 TRINITY_DN37870_c0_g1~~TRINITY_DN37870_c0_g1_i1.p1  ORF type:complete len:171 (-),score=26.01 TRINITY_DN37870_c0_g1_i1:212-724(-)